MPPADRTASLVRIGSHRPRSREVFAGGFHARGVHPVNEVTRHRQRFLRIFMIRTFADCGADMADVQHWRKTNIDIHGDHFAGHQPAGFGGQFAPSSIPSSAAKDWAAGKRVNPSRKR